MATFLSNILLAFRPKQWVKNSLLFVASFAAGLDLNLDYNKLLLGFIAFCMASSIGYILNDLADIEIDRSHPKKKLRPFASGALGVKAGLATMLFLLVMLIFILENLSIEFKLILVIYLVNSIFYSRYIKHVPVLELFSVAFGFVLRLVSGAVLMNLQISEWFIIVGGFGALFVVSAKRLAELKQSENQIVRNVVRQYSAEFLNSCCSISVGVCVTAYSIWAFSHSVNSFWFQISVIPFVISLFRYRWIAETPIVETPEDALLKDRSLIFMGTILLLILTMALY